MGKILSLLLASVYIKFTPKQVRCAPWTNCISMICVLLPRDLRFKPDYSCSKPSNDCESCTLSSLRLVSLESLVNVLRTCTKGTLIFRRRLCSPIHKELRSAGKTNVRTIDLLILEKRLFCVEAYGVGTVLVGD